MANKESHRIYIAVDPTKVARCKWCGRTESKEWIGTDTGWIYCSRECSSAAHAICSPIVVFLVFLPFVLVPPDLVGRLLVFCIILSSVLLYGASGMNHRRQIPKDSKRDDVSIDIALLRAMSSAVLCPKCDANIDVIKVSDDRVYTCDYCGASGTIEVIKTH